MARIIVFACVLNLGLLLIACRIQKDTKLAKLVRTVFFSMRRPRKRFWYRRMALIIVLACVLNLGLLLIACRIQEDTKLAKLVRTAFFSVRRPRKRF